MTVLKDIVYNNLNNAADNRYTIVSWTVDEIAYDLKCFAYDCEDVDIEDLKRHVKAWLEENSNAGS